MKRPRGSGRTPLGVPDRATLLAFLAEARGSLAPKDIARAFGVKGEDRRALSQLLRELSAEGLLAPTGRKGVASAAAPPDGGVFEVVELTTDGEPLARASGRDGLFGPQVLVLPGAKAAGPAPGIGDRFVGKTRTARGQDGPRFEVTILKRLGAGAHRIHGVFRAAAPGMGVGGLVEPADRKTRHSLTILPQHRGEARDGDLVAVRLLPQTGHGPKRAEVLEVFGSSEDPRAASILAIAAHAIPMGFSPEEEAEAEAARAPTLSGRTDLRDVPLVTIDPEDARDHDDAVFAEALPGGGFRIIVAIADVAFAVPPGSALDAGALKRGNSVYFPDRVVPMLPERLSADLCSLKQGVERACMAVEIRIDARGAKTGHSFVRGLMRSAARLTYAQAQAAIDGRSDEVTSPLLEPVLRPLWAAWGALCIARAGREPLEIDSAERRIVLSPEGKVVSIATRERLDAHRLIEEMMILANVCAAEELEARKAPVVYRVHDQPTPTKVAALADFLDTVSIRWAKGEPPTPARFNRVLALAAQGEHRETVNEVVLRTQAQAVYDTDNIGHFGLNLLKYAHFTSPIRRYADLLVHRALIGALGLGRDGLDRSEAAGLPRICEAITACERRAMAAERDATDRYVAAFLAERVGAVFAGRVTSVTRFGLFVRLAETGGDGLVPVARLGREYFHHDEAGHCLIGAETGDRWVLGQEIEVRLVEAAPVSGGLLFDVVSEPRPGRPPGRGGFRPPQRGATPRFGKGPPARPPGRGVRRRG